MSLYSKLKPSSSSQQTQGYTPPPRTQVAGDRSLTHRVTEADAIPEHRKPAITKSNRGKMGLTNNRVIEREPRGCLFKVVKYGFFDLDGYWVRVKGGWREGHAAGGRAYEYEVRRGAPRAVNKLLTEAQKKDLARVRLNARRRGVR